MLCLNTLFRYKVSIYFLVPRQWYPTQLETDIMPSVKSLTKTQNEPGKRAIRRSSMLNKMFMKHITDLMSTSTVAIDVVGRGIEISKVIYDNIIYVGK